MNHFEDTKAKIKVQKAKGKKGAGIMLALGAVAATLLPSCASNATWNSFPTRQGYEEVTVTNGYGTQTTRRTYGEYDAVKQSRANYNDARAFDTVMRGIERAAKTFDRLGR